MVIVKGIEIKSEARLLEKEVVHKIVTNVIALIS